MGNFFRVHKKSLNIGKFYSCMLISTIKIQNYAGENMIKFMNK